MTPEPFPAAPRRHRRLAGVAAAIICVGCAAWITTCRAQASAVAAGPAAKAVVDQGVRWSELKPAQQAALKPLEAEWPSIDARSKQRWLALSARFTRLTPEEQARVQARLREWTQLTPRERGEARLHFQEAKQFPLEDREARWKAYQALSPEQREQLAARAAAANGRPAARLAGTQSKSNVVPNPEYSAQPRAIGPAVVQAGPGATTTLITRRPTPPGHQQTGMPKIAATPEFVNKATLLPKRGPQGAATRSAAASSGAETSLRK